MAGNDMPRLKVLLSAFACIPGRGSEPGLGWNVSRELASHHEVWVLTQGKHRPAIEAELARDPVPNLHFAYYELPYHIRRWDHNPGGGWRKQFYYYLWQLGAFRAARGLHRQVDFDLVRHVTFVVYWKPSLLAMLRVPFIWGPVGGGESMPKGFETDFSFRGKVYETTRNLIRWLGEHDPLVRITARRSALVLATTEETANRLRGLGSRDVRVFSQVGIGERELEGPRYRKRPRSEVGIRFVSVGRLLHWKGFHLGLRAFADARLPEDEYWVVGNGPELKRLQALVEKLGISHQVKFLGRLSRAETLSCLSECDVLVHPSLHESGGMVCLEAMSLGLPVICLNLGGPAVQVTEESGFKISAIKPEQTVNDMAAAMSRFSSTRDLLTRMGEAARKRAIDFSWEERGTRMAELHREVWSQRAI
jgi:glycosyltransferase involved in cell wall biosynthesis